MQALQTYAVPSAIAAAVELTGDSIPFCRLTAVQTLGRDTTGAAAHNIRARAAVEALRKDPSPAISAAAWQAHYALMDADLDARADRWCRDDLGSGDVVQQTQPRTMAGWADRLIFDAIRIYDQARKDASPQFASAAVAVIAGVQRHRASVPRSSSRALRRLERCPAGYRPGWRGGASGGLPAPSTDVRQYRAIVERWVVPDYNGKSRPTARWETPRVPSTSILLPTHRLP